MKSRCGVECMRNVDSRFCGAFGFMPCGATTLAKHFVSEASIWKNKKPRCLEDGKILDFQDIGGGGSECLSKLSEHNYREECPVGQDYPRLSIWIIGDIEVEKFLEVLVLTE
ncbi:hypothetical protein Tco_0913835 [Tanacetum coccineum]